MTIIIIVTLILLSQLCSVFMIMLIVGIYLVRVLIKVADIIPCCDNQVFWNKIGIVWKCSAYITPGFIQSLFIIAEV